MPQWFLRFSEFTEFGESFAPFRENSIRSLTIQSVCPGCRSDLPNLWCRQSGQERLPSVLNKRNRSARFRCNCFSPNSVAGIPVTMRKCECFSPDFVTGVPVGPVTFWTRYARRRGRRNYVPWIYYYWQKIKLQFNKHYLWEYLGIINHPGGSYFLAVQLNYQKQQVNKSPVNCRGNEPPINTRI